MEKGQDFLSSLKGAAIHEQIEKGHVVQIVGKDQYKGLYGTVTKVIELSGDKIYTILLHANRQQIERTKQSLQKQYNVKK